MQRRVVEASGAVPFIVWNQHVNCMTSRAVAHRPSCRGSERRRLEVVAGQLTARSIMCGPADDREYVITT